MVVANKIHCYFKNESLSTKKVIHALEASGKERIACYLVIASLEMTFCVLQLAHFEER